MKRLLLADGRVLAYRESGTGPPLVLVHGWSMSSAVFTEALDNFSGEFRALAPDLRGHGRSDNGRGYRFADFAADLAEWFAALDLHQAGVVGWSLGGQILLKLLPEIRGRVSRVILTGTTPRFAAADDWRHGLPEGQIRVMGRDLQRNYPKAMQEFFDLQFADGEISRQRYLQIIDFAVRASRLPDPEVSLAALETLRRDDLRALLPEIDCPALVVHGDHDRITLPAAGRFLAHQLPQGRLTMIPDAGHAPFLSRPEEVFQLWREFLL